MQEWAMQERHRDREGGWQAMQDRDMCPGAEVPGEYMLYGFLYSYRRRVQGWTNINFSMPGLNMIGFSAMISLESLVSAAVGST